MVPCSTMTVMAQQMQVENEQGKQEYTFRSWNPNKEDALPHSDNQADLDPCCPVFFIIWYALETLFFRLSFSESIDHCITGKQTAKNILSDYVRGNSVACKTMTARIVLFLINLGGFYMLSAPLLKYTGSLPLVAFFL